MSAVDYHGVSHIHNLESDGTWSEIREIRTVESRDSSGGSKTDTTGVGFRTGIGTGIVGAETL